MAVNQSGLFTLGMNLLALFQQTEHRFFTSDNAARIRYLERLAQRGFRETLQILIGNRRIQGRTYARRTLQAKRYEPKLVKPYPQQQTAVGKRRYGQRYTAEL